MAGAAPHVLWSARRDAGRALLGDSAGRAAEAALAARVVSVAARGGGHADAADLVGQAAGTRPRTSALHHFTPSLCAAVGALGVEQRVAVEAVLAAPVGVLLGSAAAGLGTVVAAALAAVGAMDGSAEVVTSTAAEARALQAGALPNANVYPLSALLTDRRPQRRIMLIVWEAGRWHERDLHDLLEACRGVPPTALLICGDPHRRVTGQGDLLGQMSRLPFVARARVGRAGGSRPR